MASIKIVLIVSFIVIPFVENSPSNKMKTGSTEEELSSKVFFVDRDDEIKNNPEVIADSVLSPIQPTHQVQRSNTVRYKIFAKSVQNNPKPILATRKTESSGVSGMDDDRRIWGIAIEDKNIEEDESYYNRPLALPKIIVKSPSPVRKIIVKEVLKEEAPLDVPKPSACDMSIVICCQNSSKLKECFKSYECNNVTEDMFQYLCSTESISRIIDNLGKYYKGNQGK